MKSIRMLQTRQGSPFRRAAAVLLCLVALCFLVSVSAYETLRPGAQGPSVRSLQSALAFMGYPLIADGKYGKMTQNAVTAFQEQQSLRADGLAGRLTLGRLYGLAPQFMQETGAAATAPPPGSSVPQAPPSGRTASVRTANGGSLNLRSSASYGQNTVLQIPNGAMVLILEERGDWTKVAYEGRQGFVVSSFLASGASAAPTQAPSADVPSPSVQPPAGAAGTAQVSTPNGGSLNLRERAVAGARVLAVIPGGATVPVLARLGAWSQVRFGNRDGFVLDVFLRHSGIQAPTATPPPSASEPPPTLGTATVSTARGRFLNFRSAPASGNNIVGQIPSGARLRVISGDSDWCRVEYQGRDGYVMASFLRFDSSAQTPAPTPAPQATEAPSQTPDAGAVFGATLRLGSRGKAVEALQRRLLELKYNCRVTGSYDEMTRQAVLEFQRKNALTADGVFGSQSAGVLMGAAAIAADAPALSYRTLRIDNRDGSGGAVSAMQRALLDLGYPLSVTGTFDIPTHQAVVGFQQRNGLVISGVATPQTQAAVFSSGAKGFSMPAAQLDAGEGKGGGPAASQVRLLHWFDDVKRSASSGQRVTVYHPGSDTSFTIRFYSMGNHADSEPATWRDTQLMNRAFGTPSWNINIVYVKLVDGRWTMAAMHNRPHLTGSVNDNGFGGHLCVHFLRDMEEVNRTSPDYGASNQRALRRAWKALTGETVE